MSYQEMKRLTAGLSTKSDKIRTLGKAGYTRQQIADFLGIRYQHVRNVLVDAEKKEKAGGLAEPERAWRSEESVAGRPEKIRVQTDGTAVVPAPLLTQAGFKPGDRITAHMEAEGEVRLLSGRAALRYAQELVSRHIPANVDLLGELLKERRREFEKEEKEYRDRKDGKYE